MKKNKNFERQVVFHNNPEKYKEEIISNIKNTGERAYKRDPLDRIISIKKTGDRVEVLTTENQLARNIARQVTRAHKNFQSDISWSKNESVARIVVKFQ